MSRLLFMTQRMLMGYGVERVLHEVSARLTRHGHEVFVLCNETDESYRGSYRVIRLSRGTVNEVADLAAGLHPDAVVACTTPFFEMLPVLRHHHRTWAWECGDPSPEFFPDDGDVRQRIKRNKIDFCYPVIEGIVAISEFIKSDIEWPDARVVYCGCDHAPDLGSKGLQDVQMGREPLKVGTLMRLGKGEASYKGNGLFLDLAKAAKNAGYPMDFFAMGRGTDEDARALREAGCRVFLNADDEEKWRYLRSLDVFVSCSLWEGFNLPLVEAQAVGTLGLAFDTGAHPEVCPMVFSSLRAVMDLLSALENDRGLLLRHSRAAYYYVRRRFLWDRSTSEFERHVLGVEGAPPAEAGTLDQTPQASCPSRISILKYRIAAPVRSVRYEGLRATALKVWRRIEGAIRR